MSNQNFIPGYDDLSPAEQLDYLNRVLGANSTETTAAPTDQQGAGGDLVDMFQRGAIQGAGGLFSLAEEFTGYGGSPANYLQEQADKQIDTLSPEGKEALSKELFRNGPDGLELGDGLNPRTMSLLLAQGAGTLAPTLAMGGGAGLLARGVGAGAKLTGAASATGFGVGGGSMAQGMAGQDAASTVLAIPDEQLYQTKAFTDLWNSDFYDEAIEPAENAARVRNQLAENAASMVMRDPKLAAVNYGSNLVVGGVLSGLKTGVLASSRLGNATIGGISEGAEEFVQEGASALAVNEAAREVDPSITDDNVLPQALTGAVVGIGLGAPLGLAGKVNDARRQTADAGGDALEQELNAADALAGDVGSNRTSVNTDFDIESLNEQLRTPTTDYSQYDTPIGRRDAQTGRPTGEVVDGIDGDIEVMRQAGDKEAVDKLTRAKKILERAFVAKQAGREGMAKRLYENGAALYEDVVGEAPYSDWYREGEFVPADNAGVDSTASGAPRLERFDEFEQAPEGAPAAPESPLGVGQGPYIGRDTDLGIEDQNRVGGVMVAGMPEDYRQRREQKGKANQEAYEGQFAAPDDARINAGLEAAAIGKGQARDATVERLPNAIDTPQLDAVRAQGLDDRFANPEYRERLPVMASELIEGGGIALLTDDNGAINGRTKSQNPDWFKNNGDLPSAGFVRAAVNKALEGKKMGPKQVRAISAMMDAIDADRDRYDGPDTRSDWESLFDEASFLDSVDPTTETSVDNWIGESGAYLFDAGENAPLRTVAMLWDEALDRGVSQSELESIDKQTDTTESLASAIYERIKGNTETVTSGNNGDGRADQAEAGSAESAAQGEPDFQLNQQTEQELAAQAAAQAETEKAEAAESKKVAIDKDVGDFNLTGSDRAADVAEANGQDSLLDAVASSESKSAESETQADLSTASDKQTLRGNKIDDEWTAFSSDSGTLNIPRDNMPQVKAEHRGALANFLKARGVIGTDETVPASSLKPTQKEFSEAKVQKAKEFEGGDRAILVSGDGHVLDGHHQWMAKRDNGEDVRVIRLDAPIETLLDQVKEFPSVEQSDSSPNKPAIDKAPETLTLSGDDLDSERIKKAYSHSVRNVSGALEMEKKQYVGFIDGVRDDLSKYLSTEKSGDIEAGLKDIAAEYLRRRESVLNARSGVASSMVAGRSKFNSKQASTRGNSLDRAEAKFSQDMKAAAKNLADELGVTAIRSSRAAALVEKRAEARVKAAETLRAQERAESDRKRKLPIINESGAEISMTKAEWAKTPKDYKSISATDDYRYRTVMRVGGLKTVYISDQKEVLKPINSSEVDAETPPESIASQEPKATNDEGYSEIIEEKDADNQELPALPDDGYNYDHHKSVFVAITESGDAVQADDVRASFETLVSDPDAIKKQLSKLTIKQLTPIARPNFSGEKKNSLVDMAFKKMITDYEWLTVHEAFMTSTGGYDLESKISDARKRLDGLTQKDLRQYADDRKAAVEERKAQITALNKSLKTPETLEEFEAFVQYKGKDKFSPEQLRQYDALKAGKTIEEMDAERAAKAVKSGLDVDDELDINPIEESVHGKTGEPIFNVSLQTRLGKDKFKEAAGMARSMGGGYWKGNFYFKSREDAELFTGWLQGEDVDNSDKVAERQADKQDRRVSKLRELAAKTEEKANEKLGANRQTNTARRARMAASAENSAAREIEYARILRNVADAVDAGNAPFLANLSATTQLSELLSIKRLAIPSSMRNDPNYDGYSSSQGDLKKGITVDDYAPLIEMPRYAMYGEMVVDLGRDIANIAGLKRLSDQLIKEGGKAKDKIAISPDAVAKIKAKVGKYYTNKYGRREKFALPWQLERQAEQIGRLERMGIATGEHLRAAIRELDAIEQSSEKVKLDPLRDKERALVGKKIAGFFPTPEPVVERLLDEADIQPGMKVLEPSAGKGDIADAIREANPDAELEVVEIDSSLRDLLAAKGYEPAGRDFLEQEGEYDRIVMNPPFEKNADIEHIRHAYSLLKPGGRLVAVTSGMAGHRSDKVNSEFKAWVEEIGGVMEPLPDGSFKSSFRPTGVSTQLVVMDKPEILYSRSAANEAGATPKGVGLGSAKIAINKFLKQYTGANDVTVKVFRTHEEAHGSAAPFRTKGGYDPETDTLFIYTEALDSIADLEETLRHELLVHKGLGFVDPATLSEFLTSLRNAAKDSPELEALYNEVERVESGRSDALKAEEILARIAQDRLSFSDKVWNRIVLAVQRLMNRMFGRDISARRQGRDLVYRIGDAFAGGRRAGRRETSDMFNQSVYHGTGHDFDNFSLDAIGSGEGAQAYGWGLYFAGKRAVAEYYRDYQTDGDSSKGNLYQADIPEDNELLDWDKPLSEQSAKIKSAFSNAAGNLGRFKNDTGGEAYLRLAVDFGGVNAPRSMDAGKQASMVLSSVGIPGLRYSDAGSRIIGGKDGTYNYVIWDESRVTVEAVNDELRQAETRMMYSRDDGPESPAWKAAKAKDLDMSKEARMQRARDMGFDTDTVWYHGTNADIETFRQGVAPGWGKGVYFSDLPSDTEEFGNTTYPVYLRLKKPYTGSGVSESDIIKTGAWKEIEQKEIDRMRDVLPEGMSDDEIRGEIGGDPWGEFQESGSFANKVLRELGYDGVQVKGSNNIEGTETVVFDPANIRSVNAAFDPDQADSPNLMYSRTAELDPGREAVMSKIGLGQDTRTPIAKVKDSLKDWWREVMEGFIPAVADKFYDLKKINAEAYMRARMSTNTGAALAAALGHATPEWHEDGILKGKRDSKGLLDILKPVEGDVNNWVAWMVGKRAERLMSEGRENLLSDADIQELLSVTPEQESRFQEVADQWQEYNGAMLDVMAGGGLITQEDADFYKQDPYYIPFYRESLDSNGEVDVAAPFTKKGLSHQKDGIEALKGGESQLQDPLKNILMNVTRAIDASVKNNALRRIVDEVDTGADGSILSVLPEGEKTGKNAIRVRRNGENEYYRVHDVGVLGALTAMNDMQSTTLTRALGIPKRLLTAGVTATPTFMLRNAIRDITASWMQSEDVKWQGNKALGQFRDALKIDDDTIDMMMAGSAFMGGHRYSNDASSNADALREQLRAKGMSTASIDSYMSSLFDGSKRAWEWYKEKGERFENMARQKMFRDALDDGHSYFDAAYRAKDLMDFSLHGRAGIMHFLIQTVPFMNARIQGLYKLGRVAGNQKNMASLTQMVAFKGAMLAAATLALYALNEDDEKYQELPDWDKDANWHIFLDGEHLRIPKPFELGLMFSTIPERAARLATGDDDAKAFFGSVGRNMVETLSMNPMPQALMPVTEAAFNYDLFRGRNIDNQSDLGNLPGSRKSLYTSELAKGMGAMLEDMGVTNDLASPKRIDHIIKGYTGSMGISLLSATDAVVHMMSGNVRPAMNQRDYPVLGWFSRGDDPVGTKYSDDFYRLMGRANQAYSTIRDPNTDAERRAEIIDEYGPELKARRMLGSASKQLSKLRKRREAIYRDTTLNAEQKRQQLNNIQSMMNQIQKRSVDRAGAYEG
ncbi:MAG: hypothetical protein ACJA1I_000485 [Zhongshania marina]|jgi:hypothetical protein